MDIVSIRVYIRKWFLMSVIMCSMIYLVYPNRLESVTHVPGAPRIANYFLKWDITDADVVALASWDVVVLDMEVQHRNPQALVKLRQLNPDIILLVYLTSQEISAQVDTMGSFMRKKLLSGISEDWYLKDSNGNKLSWWSGTYLLNITNAAPVRGNERFNTYLARFVVDSLLSTGYWDGVFYDNSWDAIHYFAGPDVDTNLDQIPERNADVQWQEGMRTLYTATRARANREIILVGNNHNAAYLAELNGKMLENFSPNQWSSTMNTLHTLMSANRVGKNIAIVNSNTQNTGIQNYQTMRFGLTSSLLENAYFSYSYGDRDHGQTWKYDEYNISLGEPIGNSRSVSGKTEYVEDVWMRSFENGLSVVNSTNEVKTVSLGGEYEKIHGNQDPVVNNGSIVSEVTLAPKDGVVLLKTFETLKNIVFTNGFFARFFKPTGERARNGFFVFEEGYKGGAQIARIDLDANGKEDLMVVSGSKVQAWRDDGQLFFKLYPYGVNYTGVLRIAVGDLNNDGLYEIYTAPSAGFKEPIRVYTRHGEKTGGDFSPFGVAYSGGYQLALTKPTLTTPARLVVGSGSGIKPTITIFSAEFKKVTSFAAFESSFTGGVNVATGDVDGDGVSEIIAGKGAGGTPTVRVFSFDGKQKYTQFNAYTTQFKPGIDVRSLDIDFDGADEIITLSESAL